MFEAIVRFRESHDKGYVYNVGDEYPRDGFKATKKRIAELSSGNNKVGYPVIAEVAESDTEEATGETSGEPPLDVEE